MPATVPEGFEPFELDEGRLQPAQLIEDELIVCDSAGAETRPSRGLW